MAITVVFNTSQVIGAPQNIVVTDASTGSDINAISRRLYFQNASGGYTVPTGTSTTYIEWSLASGNTLTIQNILTEDMALSVTLMYVNVGGTSVAETTSLKGFTLFNETFYYALTQAQASQNQPPPMIIQDSNYYSNKSIFRTEIDSGNQAIVYGEDIVTAQNCYDRATYMRLNEGDYF